MMMMSQLFLIPGLKQHFSVTEARDEVITRLGQALIQQQVRGDSATHKFYHQHLLYFIASLQLTDCVMRLCSYCNGRTIDTFMMMMMMMMMN